MGKLSMGKLSMWKLTLEIQRSFDQSEHTIGNFPLVSLLISIFQGIPEKYFGENKFSPETLQTSTHQETHNTPSHLHAATVTWRQQISTAKIYNVYIYLVVLLHVALFYMLHAVLMMLYVDVIFQIRKD